MDNMDQLFLQSEFQNEMLWYESLPENRSAFLPYARPIQGFQFPVSNHQNLNKRMMEFLRTIPTMTVEENRVPENHRSHRHKINERMRREKQRQSFEALHSFLPPRTKSDKNSIVQMAIQHLSELHKLKEELQRRNYEIEAKLEAIERKKLGLKKFKLRVVESSSSMESMIGILNSLKNMRLKARMIQSEFSFEELTVVLEIETQMEAAEMEKVIEGALMEVEWKNVP